MKTFCVVLATLFFSSVKIVTVVGAADVNGLWTKTTSPDPNNIAIFYNEKGELKAMGYSEPDGRKVVWYAEGEIKGDILLCYYHYTSRAIPPGWEQEGRMELTLSRDGNEITGTATSISGKWSGTITFKRVGLFSWINE